ncbi:hypothetical protein APH_0558 [Anaplasma phagocytophilum str. HZ]|uniref:Uncharacterized protein n=1 Tax=Anaplasma phagocytophilum (strain HZ) TaxID=212042 RepID=Q2GKF1_ANAPZ|nr:hypothetical protein APH_0558 [Anaplasma phagocytophilum str. HZ]
MHPVRIWGILSMLHGELLDIVLYLGILRDT